MQRVEDEEDRVFRAEINNLNAPCLLSDVFCCCRRPARLFRYMVKFCQRVCILGTHADRAFQQLPVLVPWSSRLLRRITVPDRTRLYLYTFYTVLGCLNKPVCWHILL